MSMIHRASLVCRLLRGRAAACAIFVLVLLAPLPLWAQSDADDPRGTALVAVLCNLTDANILDTVIISIKDQEDKDVLLQLSDALGQKFGTPPTFQSFERGTPPFSDGALGLNFYMPIVKNDAATLPISPFLEVFAPYARHLRMIFIIQGPFTHRGYTKFENADVSFTVGQKEWWYEVDAIITNPLLTSATYTDNLPAGYGKTSRRNFMLYLLFGLAIVIGVSGGLLLILLMKQGKAQNTASAGNVSSGGLYERKHDDD